MKNALYFSVNVFSIKVHEPIEDTKKNSHSYWRWDSQIRLVWPLADPRIGPALRIKPMTSNPTGKFSGN